MDMLDVLCIICIRLASFLQLCRCKCTLQIISSYYLSVLGGWVPDMPSLKNGFALRILCKQPATIQEPTPTWFSAFQYLKKNHSEQWEEFTTIFHWPTFDIIFNCDVPFYQQSIWKPHDRLQSKHQQSWSFHFLQLYSPSSRCSVCLILVKSHSMLMSYLIF